MFKASEALLSRVPMLALTKAAVGMPPIDGYWEGALARDGIIQRTAVNYAITERPGCQQHFVFELYSHGCSTAQIATRSRISTKRIESKLSSICGRLRVRLDRFEKRGDR